MDYPKLGWKHRHLKKRREDRELLNPYPLSLRTNRTLDKGIQGVEKLTFQDCFIYTCDLCGKRPESRSQLEVHLEEDHDQDTSHIHIQDEPPFRIRKLDFFKKKVRLDSCLTK